MDVPFDDLKKGAVRAEHGLRWSIVRREKRLHQAQSWRTRAKPTSEKVIPPINLLAQV